MDEAMRDYLLSFDPANETASMVVEKDDIVKRYLRGEVSRHEFGRHIRNETRQFQRALGLTVGEDE